MKAYIIYSTFETIDNETFVQLFGRMENGESFVSVNKFEPYIYVREKDRKKLPKKSKIEETKLSNFEDEQVVKVLFKTKGELSNVFKSLIKKIPIYEADLNPQMKFLIEKNILSTMDIEGEYESSEKIDRVYRDAELTPVEFTPKLKVISLDTESGMSGNLYCIGLSGENYKKNFMITSRKLKNTVSCKDEAECLEKFKEELIKQDPDVIVGWNVIDFDFVFLKELFRKNKIIFDIGRTNNQPRLRVESGFFRSSSIDVPGRQVLDGLNLIKDPFIKEAPSIKHTKLDSLTLEDVSQALIKKGKLLKGKDRHKQIENLYTSNSENSLQKLVDYNLMDCELVYDILEKTKMIELAVERSQLNGLPLNKLTGSIAAFDSLYIREANAKGYVSPTSEYTKKEERIQGGYVSSLKPGIYKNVLVFDFKSLYPSIIKTFNIDPASFHEKCRKGDIKAPNGACFKNQEGVLPVIIERLHQERERAKKENRELSNHAIKVIMNSFFGVLASPNCRFFSLKMANGITHFGQHLIKLTAKEIEKLGYKTIYSDTDSVFVETKLAKTKANVLGKEIEKKINDFYKNHVKKDYSRTSYLELEFEKQYLSMMIPELRGKEGEAAKKRYAGLKLKDGKESLEIVGLEAIRGDWTEAAQDFQKELLDKLFHDEPIDRFIRAYVKKVKDGKIDGKLVYKKSIRKNLDEYTKTTPPHVKAARKLDKLESNVIRYYITLDGPEPIQKLTHKLDYDHYLEKQIKPIAQQILALLGQEFEDVIKKSKQEKLF